MPRIYKPLADHVLVRRKQKKLAGGLHIPDRAEGDHEPIEAEVLAVGPGRFLDLVDGIEHREFQAGSVSGGWDEKVKVPVYEPMPIAPGQVVLIRKYSGFSLEDGLLVVRLDDIAVIVDEPGAGAS